MVDLRLVAMQQQPILFAREIFAPQILFASDNKIGVVPAPRPLEWRRRVESDSFFAEGDFTGFEYDPEDHVAKNCRQQRTDRSGRARIGVHQFRNQKARENSLERST